MSKGAEQLVSVIISFLNEEMFLSDAIESVLQQQYSNWELILVDDGSSDKSSRIAKDYAINQPEKIKYVEHENHLNKGLSVSRNCGVAVSKGDLLAFLDADDVWSSAKLKTQVDLMNENPQGAMLCEACEYWYSWVDQTKQDFIVQIGEVKSELPTSSSLQVIDKVFDAPTLAELLYPLGKGAAPSLSGLIVRKVIFDKYGGFEEHFTGMYEDQAFLIKIYLHESVYISSLCQHKYRQREGSIVQKNHSEGSYHVIRLFFLEWLQKYLECYEVKHKKIKKLLKKALMPYHKPFFYNLRNELLKVQNRIKRLGKGF